MSLQRVPYKHLNFATDMFDRERVCKVMKDISSVLNAKGRKGQKKVIFGVRKGKIG